MKATVNSSMLPHGPRPTTIARISIELPSRISRDQGQAEGERGRGRTGLEAGEQGRVAALDERSAHRAGVGRLAAGAERRRQPPPVGQQDGMDDVGAEGQDEQDPGRRVEDQ